jgi:hypothetical protein
VSGPVVVRATTRTLDVNREMKMFDRLPASIRSALNDSPKKYVFIADWVVSCIKRYGVDQAAKLIRAGKVPNCIEVKVDCN